MKKYKAILFLVLVLTINLNYAQQKGAVKLEAIGQEYKGETKKGLANGQGKALGIEDVYEGEFKKGLPHGQGTYTWGNGSYYIGEFSKGEMDGKGKKITLDGNKAIVKTEDGYFKDNEYLGKYKEPYKVISDSGIRNIDFQKKAGTLNQVSFEVYSNGAQISSGVLDISDNKNSLVEVIANVKTITNANFPLERIEVSFTISNVRYNAVFDIYQKGNWHVVISV